MTSRYLSERFSKAASLQYELMSHYLQCAGCEYADMCMISFIFRNDIKLSKKCLIS